MRVRGGAASVFFMEPRSLGYRTDLIFPRFDGRVTDCEDCVVVRTPSNPTYHWGNFLLFGEPPGPGDDERWLARFAEEIGPPEEVGHVAFGWDDPEGRRGEVDPFLARGFTFEHGVVLAAEAVRRPPKFNQEAEIRPLGEDWEWEQAYGNQLACRSPEYGHDKGYAAFKAQQMWRYRAMVEAARGEWFGAFVQNHLVADLGLFVQDGLGRFQSVGTHPQFRRMGICSTLVYQSARYAFEMMDAARLVIVADAGYHAKDVYGSVGFEQVERQVGLSWWDRGA